MYPDYLGIIDERSVAGLPSVRRPDSDMVGLYAEELQTLLHVDTHRGAAAPDANDEVRTKAAVKDMRCQLERRLEQLVFLDELLFHGRYSPGILALVKPHYTLSDMRSRSRD